MIILYSGAVMADADGEADADMCVCGLCVGWIVVCCWAGGKEGSNLVTQSWSHSQRSKSSLDLARAKLRALDCLGLTRNSSPLSPV